MKKSSFILLLVFIAICGCKKNHSRPGVIQTRQIPGNRNYHQKVIVTGYIRSGVSDTTWALDDTTFAIQYIDDGTLRVGTIYLYYQKITTDTSGSVFWYYNGPASPQGYAHSYSLYFNADKNTIQILAGSFSSGGSGGMTVLQSF